MEEKIYAFGMDGFIVPMMKRFAAEGALPHFERILREGAVNQTLPSFPVWTPTNWATLSTGAHTGTHGVTRWRVEVAPGQRIDSFDGRANNAERIWNALERAGMKSVAVHYPAAHPSGVKSGYVVDGFGHPGHRSTEFEVASCHAYTTDAALAETIGMDHDGTAVRHVQRSVEPIPSLTPAKEWRNMPESAAPPLESSIDVAARPGGDVTTFNLLAVDSEGRGYDRVLLCRDRSGSCCIAEAGVGEWSEWAVEDFAVHGSKRPASLRFKLIELAADGSRLKLYRTQVTFTDGFTFPDALAGELLERFGPYQEHASMLPYTSGMADFETALEECEYQGMWFAEVARYMLRERGCSFFICHWHLYDYLNHIHLGDVDPVCPGYAAERAEKYLHYFRQAYQMGDRILDVCGRTRARIRTWAWCPTMVAHPTSGWPISGCSCTSRAFWRSSAARKRTWREIRCARRISTGSARGPISRMTRGSTFSSTSCRGLSSTGSRPSCCWRCARGSTRKRDVIRWLSPCRDGTRTSSGNGETSAATWSSPGTTGT